MPEDDTFRFTQSVPDGQAMSAEDVEQALLTRLQTSPPEELDNCLWALARFYSQTGRQPVAMNYMERLRANATNPETLAATHLGMGQLEEQIGDYATAALFYSQALALEPERNATWYFINNNLGYCLNQLGRPAEAEPYCRAAVAINPAWHNAYKNLGVALEGRGQWAEAARAFIQAVKANASDPRALGHLERLLEAHPDIVETFPEVLEQLERCRMAVQVARDWRRK